MSRKKLQKNTATNKPAKPPKLPKLKKSNYVAVPFVMFIAAVLAECCLLFPNGTGVVGKAVRDFLCGSLGSVVYLVPFGLIWFAFCFFAIRRNEATAVKVSALVVFTIAFSACQSAALYPSLTEVAKFSDYYKNGVEGIGGGAVGGLIGRLSVLAFDRVFSVVILAVVCIASLSFFIGTEKVGIWSWVVLKIKRSRSAQSPKNLPIPKEPDAPVSASDIPRIPTNIQPAIVKTTVYQPEPVKISEPSIPDPFMYGDEIERSCYHDQGCDLQESEANERVLDAPSSKPNTSPASKLPLDSNGTPRAYSPFAQPFFEEQKLTAKNSSSYAQPSNQDIPRAYSPFADPFTSMSDLQKKQAIPPQTAIACDSAQSENATQATTQAQPQEQKKRGGLFKFLKHPEEITVTEEQPVSAISKNTAEIKEEECELPVFEPLVRAVPEVTVIKDYPPFDMDEDDEGFDEADDTAFDDPTLMEKPQAEGDIRQVYGSEPRYPNYVYPTFDLLDPVKQLNQISEEEILEVRNTLLEKLASFRVEATLSGYSVGPTITRYEITPGPGVKVRQITALTDDLALALQSDGVRIATVSGKSVIGVEVPNEKVSVVSLRGLLESREFINAKSRITVCVGLTVTGKPVYMDIDDMPHVLIAGETKSGKSVAINCMILSLLYRASPDEVQLILIDPKRVELNVYSRIPHLVMPVIDDPKRAAAALRWAVNEMDRRYMLLDKMGVRNREEYCELRKQDPSLECMPQIIIVIDELADLMLQVREYVEELINRLAAMARACGIHLLVGTQRPSVDIITGLIKANIPARIAFKVSSAQDSRIILGGIGAEKLLGRGDMLYQATGAGRMRIQGAFVSGTEIKRLTKFIIDNNGAAEFDPEVMRSLDAEMDRMNKSSKKATYTDDDGDNGTVDGYEPDFDLLCRAIEYILETGKTSTNNIQRVLHVGFNRAADIVDALEDMGFLSRREGNRPRDVQVTWEMYEEWKMRKQL